MRKDTSSFAPGMERGAGIGSAVFVVAFLKAASAASREFGVLCFNFFSPLCSVGEIVYAIDPAGGWKGGRVV